MEEFEELVLYLKKSLNNLSTSLIVSKTKISRSQIYRYQNYKNSTLPDISLNNFIKLFSGMKLTYKTLFFDGYYSEYDKKLFSNILKNRIEELKGTGVKVTLSNLKDSHFIKYILNSERGVSLESFILICNELHLDYITTLKQVIKKEME